MKKGFIILIMICSVFFSHASAYADALSDAYEELSFEDISFEEQDKLTLDLAFIPKYKGFDISWTSSDISLITSEGIVNRPGIGEDDKMAVVKAAIGSGADKKEKEFPVTVLAFRTEEEILEKVKYNLTFDKLCTDSIDEAQSTLTLPSKGEYNTLILWQSSDSGALSIVPEGENYKGTVNTAHFSDGNYSVLLKATIIYGNSYMQKEFYIRTAEKKLVYNYTDKLLSAADKFDRIFKRFNNINAVKGDLNLPSIDGIDIEFNSNKPDIVQTDGKVIRPVFEDTYVSFFVTIANGFEKIHKIYSLNVKARGKEEIQDLISDDLRWAIETLKSQYSLSNITSDIMLPQNGINGTKITWSSNNPSVLTSDGRVKRADEDVNIELTAKVFFGDNYEQESVKLCVKAKEKQPISQDGGSKKSGFGGGSISGSGSNSEPIRKASFDDVETTHWAYNAVETLAERGIIRGVEDRRFAPAAFATREAFVKMLVLANGIEAKDCGNGFRDVDTNSWYYPYISTAKHMGIVGGVSSDLFGVGRNITRQDICTLVYRAFFEGETAAVSDYTDAGEISDYAIEAVNVLNAKGIVTGDDSGSFRPKENASRAEIAMILYRILKG